MANEAICFQQPLAPISNGSGSAYASGSVGFYTPSTTNTINVYSDIGLSVALPNPVPLNASGYTSVSTVGSPTPVYLQQTSYDYIIYDSLNAIVLGPVTVSGSAWPGQIQSAAVSSPAANANAYTNRVQATINKASSGTHALFAGTRFDAPTIGAGASTLTEAATVYIAGAPASGTNQYALHVASGGAQFDGESSIILKTFAEKVATVTFSATPTFDLSTANNFTITLSGNITSQTVSNWTAAEGTTVTIHYRQDNSGGHTTAFPAGWRWSGGSVPSITTTANKAAIIILYSPDAGSAIYASVYTDNA
jgi:hypothetical protein